MNLISFFKKIINFLLDTAFPRTKLEKKLSEITAEELYSEAPKTRNEDKKMITVFSYEDKLIKEAISSFKFRKNKRLAKIFAQILYDEILEHMSELETFSNFKKPILIPIPLSKQRMRERGFNQCELIAKEMSILDKDSSFVFEKNVLIKIKDTPHQSRAKNKKERLENLKKSFSVKQSEKIRGKNILLLDDVTTTGTTLKEASKTLRRYGAKKIICLTIAH
ncbi:ComF family protein [Patescibacteria group bacterium]|nr:ComF family protein [Patescibacteria group bacterium]